MSVRTGCGISAPRAGISSALVLSRIEVPRTPSLRRIPSHASWLRSCCPDKRASHVSNSGTLDRHDAGSWAERRPAVRHMVRRTRTCRERVPPLGPVHEPGRGRRLLQSRTQRGHHYIPARGRALGVSPSDSVYAIPVVRCQPAQSTIDARGGQSPGRDRWLQQRFLPTALRLYFLTPPGLTGGRVFAAVERHGTQT